MAPVTSLVTVSGISQVSATSLPGSWTDRTVGVQGPFLDGNDAPVVARAEPTPTDQSHTTTSSEASSTTASSAATGAQAASTGSSTAATAGDSKGSDTYKLYKGNGDSFPTMEQWVSSFDDMWTANLPLINKGCSGMGVPANSNEDNTNLKAAIQSAAQGSKLDPRFILAAVMQESKGCVRVKTTTGSVSNPGLLQDHSGPGTCNPGTPEATCPKSEIDQMIDDGIFGTQAPGKATGDGYLQTFQQAKNDNPANEAVQYYIAARIYNSGSYVDNRLECGVATHCYASDIANRLTGWVNAPSSCSETSISAGCPSS